MEWLKGIEHPVLQALLATCFTWFVTAAGSALVFVFKTINRKVLDGMLGFAAGVMIAASYWSLLAPAIAMAEEAGGIPWLPATGGFLLGGAFLWVVDKILPHLHPGFPADEAEGIKTTWQRSVLLVLAILAFMPVSVSAAEPEIVQISPDTYLIISRSRTIFGR